MGENIEVAVSNLALKEEQQGDIVDPWTVSSNSDAGIDYEKLISKNLQNIQ